jgi:hypothetical protein
VFAVQVAPHGDPRAGTAASAGLLGYLQRDVVEDHDIVAPDGALLQVTEDRVKVDAVQGHEST